MTVWEPDTCLCSVEFDAVSLKQVKAHKKCGLHSNIPDADLLSVLLAHNRSFNLIVGTEQEKKQAKELERERAKLG